MIQPHRRIHGRDEPGRSLLRTVRLPTAICTLLVAATWCARATPPSDAPAEDEPVPIRRVLLRPSQLAEELERVRRGILLQFPRSDFQALLRRASAAVRAGQSPPALVEARYQASLIGDALVGTARWRILSAGPAPTLLAVEPINLAVRSARWADERDAVLGDLDPRKHAQRAELLVNRPGDQTLSLEWSARGVPEPDGVRFDWRVPPCAVSTLDLELPPGYEPLCQRDGCLITGPTPAVAPDRRAWRLLFGGASQLELVIRPPSDAGPQPLAMVRQQNVQDLSPGQAMCEFSLDLDVRHGGLRELRLEYDARVRPIDVAVRNLARWHILDGDEETPNQIAVEFSEPFRGGVLTVRAVGPVPINRTWASPWVRVAGAVPRGEEIVIRVHPELAYDDWKAGSYRLQEASVSADQRVVWTLRGGAVRAASTRPSARFRVRSVDYQVRQQLWWQVGPGVGETLTAHCTFDVRRGPVFQVPWAIPADWDVLQVEADPADSLAGWSVAPPVTSGSPATLTVELLRPLTPTGVAQLQFNMVRRRAALAPNGRATMTPPDVRPLDATAREGTLAVKVAPDYHASWSGGGADRSESTIAMASRPADTTVPAPWAPAVSDLVFDLGPHGVTGTLLLRSLPSRYRAYGRTQLTVVGRHALITHRLALEPQSGATDTVLVRTTADDDSTWDWRVVSGANRVRGVQRVDVISGVARAAAAAVSPWAAIVTPTRPPRRGDVLLAVGLERPLSEPIELQADLHLVLPPETDAARTATAVGMLAVRTPLQSAALAAAFKTPGEWPLNVPLISAPAAAGGTGSITVDLTAASGIGFRASGMTEIPTAETCARWRQFVTGSGPASLSLTRGGEAPHGMVTGATLRTDLSHANRQVHHLNVRLHDWPAGNFTVGLPNDAIVQRMLIGGVIAPPKLPVQSAEGLEFTIELPRGGPEIGLDVTFATPQRPWHVGTRLHAPLVRLPDEVQVRHVWHLPAGVAPLRQQGWRTRPAAFDSASFPADPANAVDWMSEDNTPTVWVVRDADVAAIGLTLAAALAIGVTLAGNRVRLVLTVAVAAAGLLIIWLPGPIRPAAWWVFVVATTAWACAPLGGSEPGGQRVYARREELSSRKSVLAGVAIVAVLATSGRAAGPAPSTVYLVPGPEGEVTSVLVSPDLIEQLRDLERTGVAALDGARLTTAHYTGQIDGQTARLQGRFEIECFAEGPAVLSLPLTGVVLRDALLDGVPAYPRAAGDRYTVVVNGRGRHVLELNLQAPVGGTAEDKEIRFGGPEVLQSALTLDLPAGARLPHAVGRRGAQTVTDAGGRPRLEADLGRTAGILVRWQTAAADPSRATIAVQEAYLWDISGSGAILHSALRYTISGGSITSIPVELPKDVLVAAVTARPLDAAASGAPAGWLRHWHTSTHDRGGRLTLDFGAPITGNWQVTLSLVPRAPWPAGVTLSFPAAEGKKAAPPVYAYRARDLTVSLTRTTGVAPFAEDLFLRDRWLPAQVEADPSRPTRAFQRSGGGAPTLRLTIAATASNVESLETWTWRVGPEYADVRAESRVSAQGGAVSLLEWDVPATVRVADLRGPDVSNWTRTGGRLQVWLRRPVTDATVQWAGTVVRTGPGTPPPSAAAARFDVPTIRPVGMSFRGSIIVTAVTGWLASPLQTTHLRPADTPEGGGRTWHYLTESPGYQAAFQVRPATSDGEFQVLTTAGLRDGTFRADTTIESLGGRTKGGPWLVTARPGGGFQYRINAPGARVREIAAVTDGRAWTVDWPEASAKTSPARVEITATGQPATDNDRPPEWALPHIEVASNGRRPGRLVHTVRLNNGLSAVEIEGLRPVEHTAQAVNGVRGASYMVQDDGWVLRVRPAVTPRQAELRATQTEVARGEDGRWRVRLSGQLTAPPGANLRLQWPALVRVRRVTVDEGRFVPPPEETTGFPFALDERPGLRAIVLEWTTDSGAPPGEAQLPKLYAGDTPLPISPVRWVFAASAPAPDWARPAARTVLLIGLLAAAICWSRRFGEAAWPERLAVLGAVGWAAAGGWYWLIPIVVGVLARGRRTIQDMARRRRSATSPAPLSS